MNIYDRCDKYCPKECESMSLKTYPYVEILNGNNNSSNFMYSNFTSFSDFKMNFFGIIVYYRELNYILSSQQIKVTELDLISNIGGILGVFVGISFLSLIELIEIALEMIFIYCDNKKKLSFSKKIQPVLKH